MVNTRIHTRNFILGSPFIQPAPLDVFVPFQGLLCIYLIVSGPMFSNTPPELSLHFQLPPVTLTWGFSCTPNTTCPKVNFLLHPWDHIGKGFNFYECCLYLQCLEGKEGNGMWHLFIFNIFYWLCYYSSPIFTSLYISLPYTSHPTSNLPT